MKKITFILTIISLLFINGNNLQAQVTPSPTTMEHGTTISVLITGTNPSIDQSASSLLNGFDISMDSSSAKFIAFATSGNGAGTDQTAGPADAALYFGGDALGTSNSCTLSTDSGNEIGITSFDFAYEFNSGTTILTFIASGKKDGVEVGTKTINVAHNTLINVDLTNPTTGSFIDIDELTLTPSVPFIGGWSLDSIVVVPAIVSDTTEPILSSSAPTDGATGIAINSNIVLTFNENIAFGTGNIQVIDVTDASNSFTINTASPGSLASINGAVLTINPSTNLDDNSNYAVQIAATAIDDISGNSYAGITNNTTLDFTTVAPIPLTITVAANNKTYDGNTTTTVGAASLSGVSSGDDVSINGVPSAFNFASTNVGSGITVNATGNYTITGADAEKYTLIQPSFSADIISAALTVTADAGQTKTYGTTDPIVTYTITGFVNGNVEADLDTPVSISRVAGENVGTYTITPAAATDSNYTVSFITNTFAITATALTVTSDAGQTKTYGTPDPIVTYTITGFVNGDVEADLDTPVSISRVTGENVGTYTITPAAATDSNYTVSFITNTFAITATALTVTADAGQTKTYGTPDPTLTYTITGFVNGDVEADLDTPVSVSRVTGENVGTYTITPAAATDSNYTVSFITNTFAITATALTVTADAGQTKTYGTPDPTLTYTITGFVNGDVEADLDTPVSISRVTGENAGTYTITPAAATDSNYTVSFVTNTFAITATALTVTADAGQTKTYGTTDPIVTYTITGFVNGDVEADLDTPVSISRVTGENVGTYTITPAAATDSNYTVSFITNTFAITATALTVTADAGQTKTYGTPDPIVTYTITGFVNGDVEADLDTPVNISRVTGENVGTYTITPAAATDSNYTVSFITNTFAITATALTVTADAGQTKTYGTPDPIITYTITGFVNGDVEADLDTPVSISRVTGENVGTYTITPAAATDLNYTVSFITNTFAITAGTLTLTVNANNKNYDGTTTATTGTASLNGTEAGDDVSIDSVPSAFNFVTENVGTGITVTATGNYTITGTDAGNYAVTQPTNLSANISEKELTITGLTGNDKVFDGTTLASASGTANLAGIFAGDVVALGGSPIYTFATSNIGAGITITTTGYTISGGDSGNYTLTQPTLSANITGDTLTLDDISVTDATCNGATDGAVIATVSGGSAPYSYQWSTGATTTGNFLNNLAGGNYSVTIVDALNNSVMQNFTIAQGTSLDATVTEGATVYLGYAPAATTSISVETITGGSAPYTYEWNTGETTQSIEVSPNETTTYTVTITDSNGCSTTADAIVNVIDVRCGHHGHHNKVKVCHKGRRTICVPWWAARWHLKHGDTLGGCDSTTNEVQITNLKVYPNPFKHHLHVKFNSTTDADIDLTVFNNRGKKVFKKTLSITEGTTKTKLNLSRLRRGYYYLKIVVNGEVKKIRHLIKR